MKDSQQALRFTQISRPLPSGEGVAVHGWYAADDSCALGGYGAGRAARQRPGQELLGSVRKRVVRVGHL